MRENPTIALFLLRESNHGLAFRLDLLNRRCSQDLMDLAHARRSHKSDMVLHLGATNDMRMFIQSKSGESAKPQVGVDAVQDAGERVHATVNGRQPAVPTSRMNRVSSC